MNFLKLVRRDLGGTMEDREQAAADRGVRPVGNRLRRVPVGTPAAGSHTGFSEWRVGGLRLEEDVDFRSRREWMPARPAA